MSKRWNYTLIQCYRINLDSLGNIWLGKNLRIFLAGLGLDIRLRVPVYIIVQVSMKPTSTLCTISTGLFKNPRMGSALFTVNKYYPNPHIMTCWEASHIALFPTSIPANSTYAINHISNSFTEAPIALCGNSQFDEAIFIATQMRSVCHPFT